MPCSRGFITGWQQVNPASGHAAPGPHGRGVFVQAVQRPSISCPGGLVLASTPGQVLAGAQDPQILAACQRSGFSPRVAAYSGQADFIQAMVAAGMGVAFLPRLICHGIRAPVTCSLLDDDQLRWRITLAWKRDARLSPAACSYLELTRSALIAGSLEPGLTSPGSGRRSPARSGPTGWRS